MRTANLAISLLFLLAVGGHSRQTFSGDDPNPQGDARLPRLVAQLGHTQPITMIAVSPDGRLLATGGADSWVILWDATSLKELRRLRDPLAKNFCSQVNDIKFSPDGCFLAAQVSSFLDSGSYYVWEVSTGRLLPLGLNDLQNTFTSSNEQRPFIQAVSFSPDSKFCLAVQSGKIRLIPLESPETARLFFENSGQVNDIAISPDGLWAAIGLEDGTARICSVADGAQLAFLPWPGASASASVKAPPDFASDKAPPPPPASNDFSTPPPPATRPSASAARKGTSNVAPPPPPPPDRQNPAPTNSSETSQHEGPLQSLLHALFGTEKKSSPSPAPKKPDGSSLNLPRERGGWSSPSIETSKTTFRTGLAEGGAGDDQSIGGLFAQASAPPTAATVPNGVNIPSPKQEEPSEEFRSRWPISPVKVVSIAPTGTQVAIGTLAGRVGLFDPKSGKALWMVRLSAPIDQLHFSTDGQRLVIRTWRKFHVVSTKSGAIVDSYDRSRSVWSAEYSPNGMHVVTGGQDCKVRLWDSKSGRLEHVFLGPGSAVDRVAISADGRQVVAHSVDDRFWRWDLQSGALRGRDKLSETGADAEPKTGDDRAPAPSGGDLAPPPPAPSTYAPPVDSSALRGISKSTTPIDAKQHRDTASFPRFAAFVKSGEGVESPATESEESLPESSSDAEFWGSPRRYDVYSLLLPAVCPNGQPRLNDRTAVISTNGRWAVPEKPSVLFDISAGKPRRSLTELFGKRLVVASYQTRTLAVSNDGNLILLRPGAEYQRPIATISQAIPVELWSTISGKRVSQFEVPDSEPTSGAISSDNNWLATASNTGAVQLWSASNGHKFGILFGHTESVSCVQFSPDTKRVAASALDGTVCVWDRASRKLLQRLTGHSRAATSVAFSADGNSLLTASADETARRWDISSGRELTHYAASAGPAIAEIQYADDGSKIVSQKNGLVLVIPTSKQQASRQLITSQPGELMTAVTASADGRKVFVATTEQRAIDSTIAQEGAEIGWSENLRLKLACWNVTADKPAEVMQSPVVAGISTATSSTKLPLVTLHLNGQVRRWRGDGPPEINGASIAKSGHGLAMSPDLGKALVLTNALTGDAEIRDTRSGKTLGALPKATEFSLECLEGDYSGATRIFSPDGKQMFWPITDEPQSVWILDASNGRVLRKLSGHQGPITAFAFSPDGKLAATSSVDRTVRIWDTSSGQAQQVLRGHQAEVLSVAWHPSGGWLATSGADGRLILWHTSTGRQVWRQVILMAANRSLDDHSSAPPAPKDELAPPAPQSRNDPSRSGAGVIPVSMKEARADDGLIAETNPGATKPAIVERIAFSPDGRLILSKARGEFGSWDVQLWETSTGKSHVKCKVPEFEEFEMTISPDGSRLLGSSIIDDDVIVWDTTNGEVVHKLRGHVPGANAAGFMASGRAIYTSTPDGRARLWSTATGEELCTLIAFENGGWAVVDPQGRFDATNGGDIAGLHWVVGYEPIELAQLKDRYYEPGLLAKKLGLSHEPLRDVGVFGQLKLHPAFSVRPPTADDPTVTINLTNRGGGIGRVVVKLRGKEVTSDARGPDFDPAAAQATIKVSLLGDPRLTPGEPNDIEVLAYNADGYLRSREWRGEFTPEGNLVHDPTQLWAVVAGVSEYRGNQISLRYAAKDAEDFAFALQVAAQRLFGANNVHISLLSTSSAVTAPGLQSVSPTRINLVEALAQLKQTARPHDIVIIFLAGHGATAGGQDGDFYFLTADAQSTELTDPELRHQVAISSDEFVDLLKENQARNQVLILDTCASGRLAEQIFAKREVSSSSQRRALERIKERAGMHILAGCASDRASYEASRFGQGLLTYSVLFGMRGPALREGQFVDVARLFQFAADQVPSLAKDIGGIQRPIIAEPPGGGSIDIGQLTLEDKAKIPVQNTRPMMLRTVFLDKQQSFDRLTLSQRIDELLAEESTRGRQAKLVFVDTIQCPGACQLSGQYTESQGRLTMNVVMVRDGRQLAQFPITGQSAKLDEFASNIVREATRRFQTETTQTAP
jgi:WD40 repeat protein